MLYVITYVIFLFEVGVLKRSRVILFSFIFFVIIFGFNSYAEEYTYDDNGRVSKVVHDDGSVTTYEYDQNGNIISVDTTYSKIDENIGSNTSQSSTSGNELDEYTTIDTSVPENENLDSNIDIQTNKNKNLDNGNIDNDTDNTSKDVANNNGSEANQKSILTGDSVYIIPVAILLVISLTGIIIVIKKRNEEH